MTAGKDLRLISPELEDDIREYLTRENPFRPPIQPVRHSRIRSLTYRWHVLRGRLEMALDVLRGEHECGDFWDD